MFSKLIKVSAVITIGLLIFSSCGNSDYENLKAENEALKQQLEQNSTIAETVPPETEKPKSEQPLKLTLQEVYGENYGYIETNFTVVNCTDKAINTVGLTVDEYNADKQLIANTYPQMPNRLEPGESIVFDCLHKMDFNLIQYVKVSGYSYYDDNNQFYQGYFKDTEMMPIYENWTKEKQMGNQ